jgi:hypothetical protein
MGIDTVFATRITQAGGTTNAGEYEERDPKE